MNRIDRNIVKFWTLHSLALWLVSSTASAQIYKSVDENGVVTFRDVPPAASSGKTSTVVKPDVTNSMPNPTPERFWTHSGSTDLIKQIFNDRMFPLTLEGLDAAMRELSR